MNTSNIIYYPKLDDINFNKIISHKKEFLQYSSHNLNNYTIDNLCNADNFISRPIQRLLQSFISPNTPYNSLFLYHTVGSGKTCTSILISQQFLDYLLKYKKQVHIIAPPAIQENFLDTIFDSNKDIYKLNNNRTTQCTNYIYIDIWNKYLKEYNNNIEKTQKAMKAYKNIRFSQHGYISFNNSITKKNGEFISPEDIKERYSNSIFIIDEIHLIREEGNNFKGFEYLFKHVDNCKLLILSATPMFNDPTQIIDILNLLLLNDKRPTITDSDIFDKDYNIINRELLIKNTTGYISYIKTINPISFPIKLYPDNSQYVKLNKEKNNIEFLDNNISGYNIFPCEITEKHFNIINKFNLNDLISASQANTIVFPTNNYGDKGFNECFTYNKSIDKYTYNLFPGFLKENIIKEYSAKLYKLIQELKVSNGKIFIFSQFIKPGAYLIGMLLEELGYNRKILVNNKLTISNLLKTNNKNNKSYILITGEDQKKIHKYISHFNNENNINGENINIIIGSRVIEQGINLFNLREIHLIDPWWNYSRIIQIIGRGFRDCAHQHLPPQKRNITIYNYISTYKNELTQDIRQVISLLKKQYTINAVSKVLKQNSIDCNFNKNVNVNKNFKNIEMINSKNKTIIVNPNDIDYTLDCDYDVCEYDCEYDLSNNPDYKIDETTYNFFNDSISNINIVKIWIKKLFEIKILYKYEEIETILLNNDNYLTKDAIYIGLVSLVNNKESVYDKFNREGYIINKQLYYIFQPNDIVDDNIPLYLRELPLKDRLYSISNLYNIKLNNNLFTTTTTNNNISNNIFYKDIINTIYKYYPKNNKYNNLQIYDILTLYIQHDNLYDILQESIQKNKSRYYIKLTTHFYNNININNKWTTIKKFYEFELIKTEYKQILLLYLTIKSIKKIPLSDFDSLMIKYYDDLFLKNNNNDIFGFIIYTHNPNYINELNNNIDAYTEIPQINIFINNEWYLNNSIHDINNILYDITPLLTNLQKKYNTIISSIKYNLLYNNQIIGIIGKSQSEDISVFKIIKFIKHTSINKKEKLTNITISNIKDIQENILIDIIKLLITNITELNINSSYDIQSIEDILNTYINSSNIKKSNYISLILFILYDLDRNNFGNRRWLISSYEASILKKNSLLDINRSDKENISLSIHKGLLV
tara:strand:- start:133 stop:3609 length:3477 start_codon:yes stop_codon:yes gene_type:complete